MLVLSSLMQTVTLKARELDKEIPSSQKEEISRQECGPHQNYSCDCWTNRILSSHSLLPLLTLAVTRSNPNWIFSCQCLYTPHLPHSVASPPDRKPLLFHFHLSLSSFLLHPISSFFTRGLNFLTLTLSSIFSSSSLKSPTLNQIRVNGAVWELIREHKEA